MSDNANRGGEKRLADSLAASRRGEGEVVIAVRAAREVGLCLVNLSEV